MKHFLNARIRSIYYLLLIIIWTGLAKIFKMNMNFLDLIILVGLFVAYYLFDIAIFKKNSKILQKIGLSVILNIGGIIVLSYFKKMKLPIIPMVIFTIVQIALIPILTKINKKNIRVAILGSGEDASRVRKILSQNEEFEYIGYMDSRENDSNYLGKIENIEEIIRRNKIEKIIFTSRKQVKIYSDLVMKVKLRGIKVRDYISFTEKYEGKVDVDKIDSLWVLMTEGFESLNSNLEKRIKRVFDLTLALVIGILTFPLMIISIIIIKLESKGPLIYSQARIGQNQKEFYVHKFRSMVQDAEKNGAVWAVKNDARVTKYGNFMRKTRIDELPQIWNVLKGEMSFIGPRPERQVFIDEIEKEVKNYNMRHCLKPGLTGWAQVMYPYGASVEDAKRKLEYDLYYVKNQSLALDMIIMFKTVQTVIFGRGR